MGRLASQQRFSLSAGRQRMASMVTGILAALAGIGLLAALWFVPDHRLGLLGGLLLAVGPVLVIYARKYRRLQAVTGSEGVALIENDAVLPCRWHDIQIVRETQLAGELQSTLKASVRGEDHLFHITCRDGKELIFRSFLDDLAWLGQIIQHETLSHLLPPSLIAPEKWRNATVRTSQPRFRGLEIRSGEMFVVG